MMIGCSRCGKVWDNCECPDLEILGNNLDMFEKDIEVVEKIMDDNSEVLSKLAKEDTNKHYKHGNIQPIDLIKDMGDLKPFCLGNAIKYIVRSRHKGSERRDIEKAIDYLKMVLEEL